MDLLLYMQGENRKMRFRNSTAKNRPSFKNSSSDLSPSSWIEIRLSSNKGEKTVHLAKVTAVLKYSDSEIMLRLHRESVSFTGRHLVFSSYRNGSATVTGLLENVAFDGGRR